MQQTFGSGFEFDRGPVLWGAATTLTVGAAVFFALHRPSWVLPGAFAAGGVAGARGGFYDQSANNGFLGVALGLIGLLPSVLLYRLAFVPAASTEHDALFFAAVLSMVDLLAYGPLMLVAGYLGGVVADFLRRRVGGPIGY
jgi:divalent metal cation (Fe/Co/Zn/Cd) transporter